MASRYGRNKKRKDRQRIEELTDALARERGVRIWNEARMIDAAFKKYMERHDLLHDAMMRITHAIGRQLGDELKPHAERLLASSRARGFDTTPNFSVEKRYDDSFDAMTLSGEIPKIRYSIVIAS